MFAGDFDALLLGIQSRIGFRVNPVTVLRRYVTSQAIGLVIGRDVLSRIVGFIQCPASAFPPQRIISKAILTVLDHDKPLFEFTGGITHPLPCGEVTLLRCA